MLIYSGFIPIFKLVNKYFKIFSVVISKTVSIDIAHINKSSLESLLILSVKLKVHQKVCEPLL